MIFPYHSREYKDCHAYLGILQLRRYDLVVLHSQLEFKLDRRLFSVTQKRNPARVCKLEPLAYLLGEMTTVLLQINQSLAAFPQLRERVADSENVFCQVFFVLNVVKVANCSTLELVPALDCTGENVCHLGQDVNRIRSPFCRVSFVIRSFLLIMCLVAVKRA